ncbi:MAG: hypothetical protein V1696_01745 [Candidatus Jorgensenbacteria bacterium]
MNEFKALLQQVVRETLHASKRYTGVHIEELERGDEIAIRTINSEYRCTMVEPRKGLAIVTSTGGIFSASDLVHLVGSCILTSPVIVRCGWLGLGYPILIEGCITSPLQRLAVNGETLLPRVPDHATQ